MNFMFQPLERIFQDLEHTFQELEYRLCPGVFIKFPWRREEILSVGGRRMSVLACHIVSVRCVAHFWLWTKRPFGEKEIKIQTFKYKNYEH